MQNPQRKIDQLSRLLDNAVVLKSQGDRIKPSHYKAALDQLESHVSETQSSRHSQLRPLKNVNSSHKRSQSHQKSVYEQLIKEKQRVKEALDKEERRRHQEQISERDYKRKQQLAYRAALDQQIFEKQKRGKEGGENRQSLKQEQELDQLNKQIDDLYPGSDSSAHETELQDEFDEDELEKQKLEERRQQILSRYSRIMGKSRLRKLSSDFNYPPSQQESIRSSRKSLNYSTISSYTPEQAMELYKKLTEKEDAIRREKEELFNLLEESRSSRATTRMTTVSRMMLPRVKSPEKQDLKYKTVPAVTYLPQLTPKRVEKEKEEDAASVISRMFD